MDQIKHYKIIERIGSGGMGVVYKAHDTILERDVAIKVMHPHLLVDGQNSLRLMREARAAAKLVHPNVVTIYEISEDKSHQFIVMELIQGMPLTDFIYENKSIDPERAVKLTIQILKALSLAHNKGILHRDIKSDNIILTPGDEVKVLDFGIAKILNNNSLTEGNEIMGTIEYMAPEQMLGQEIDQRCDVYAVGIVLYQLLTQRLPFTGESPVQILFNKLNEEPIPPSNFNANIDKDLNLIVMQAITDEKEDRWKSTTDFSEALESFLHKMSDRDKNSKTSQIDFDIEFEEKDDKESSLRNVFVGRNKEFKKLVRSFNNIKSGNGITHVISGEAGVGKSSLAKKFTAYSEHHDAWVLYGLCLYQEGLDAYLPFIDAIRGFFSRSNGNLNDEERTKLKNQIRKNVPILSEFTDRFTTTLIPQSDRDSNKSEKSANLLESFAKLISFMAETRPLIIILDDLQWADAASLHLFHYLARKITNYPVMLLGLARSNRFDLHENGKPTLWVETKSRMSREDLFDLIDLDNLPRENCDQLIEKSLGNIGFSDEFHHKIFNTTKGNPFFILETLKTLQAKGNILLRDEVWIEDKINFKMEVPNRVEDIFIQRLSAIKEDEREILQVAAVIGRKFDHSILAHILGMPRIKLLKSLEKITKNLEIIHSDDNYYQFEHPLLWELLYSEIPAVLRKEYHLLIANHLVKIYGSDFGSFVGEVAQHFRRGGDHDKAIIPLNQAAHRSFVLSAYREASFFFEDLLDSIDKSDIDVPKDISFIDLYFKLGICYEEMGDWENGIRAYTMLEEVSLAHKDYVKHVNAIMRVGRIHDKFGNWKVAKEAYTRSLDLAEKYKIKNVKSRIYNNLGIYFFQKGDFDNALEYFQTSIQSTDSKEGDFDKAHAHTNIGIIANILRGCNGVAMENFKKALEIYEKKGSKQNQARVYQNIGMFYADMAEWDKSIEAFQNCLEMINETDEKQLRALTYLNLGKTYVRKQELVNAKSFTEKAVKMFKRTKDILGIAEAYHIYGLIYGTGGNFKKAKSFLNESIKINIEKDYQEGLADTYESYARLSYENNLPDTAKEYYKKALGIYKMMNIDVKVKELYQYIEDLKAENKNNNVDNKLLVKNMANQLTTVENLKSENALLLDELATSYKNMEMILLQSSKEKKIAYQELEDKYQLLQHTFAELSKSENLLIHLEKLSSIGQFIAEIIHELNNPLTVISALSELALLQEVPGELREQLEKILKQVGRMSNYLNRFKAMAYKSEEEFQYFDINSNLLDFLETIEIVKPKSVQINKNISPKPLLVKGDPYQVSQIYLNLAKNAFDAMADKGSCLTVTSQEVKTDDLINNDLLGPMYCQSKNQWEAILKKSTVFAHVEFKDDAGGIPSELISDIFTPFFTTKVRGKGTGLGLSIATDIVNRHNANLGVRSTLDDGTVFQFFIPLAELSEQSEENTLIEEAAKS